MAGVWYTLILMVLIDRIGADEIAEARKEPGNDGAPCRDIHQICSSLASQCGENRSIREKVCPVTCNACTGSVRETGTVGNSTEEVTSSETPSNMSIITNDGTPSITSPAGGPSNSTEGTPLTSPTGTITPAGAPSNATEGTLSTSTTGTTTQAGAPSNATEGTLSTSTTGTTTQAGAPSNTTEGTPSTLTSTITPAGAPPNSTEVTSSTTTSSAGTPSNSTEETPSTTTGTTTPAGAPSNSTEGAPSTPTTTSSTVPTPPVINATERPYVCNSDFTLLTKLAEVNSNFALKIYNHLLERVYRDNFVFSAPAIALSLGIIESGAGSASLSELHNILSPTMTIEQSASALAALVASLRGEGGQSHEYNLHLINGIYVDQNYPISNTFLEGSTRCFDAKLFNVDFKKKFDTTRSEMDQWVLENTKFKIQHIFPPSSIDTDDRLVLMNIAYLDANWETTFTNGRTYTRLFYPPNNVPGVETPMISVTGNFRYYEQPDLQVLGIDYKLRELTMFIFLPTSREGLGQFERQLDVKELQRLMASTQMTKLDVTIPKFSINYRLNVKETLEALGIKQIFDETAGSMKGISSKRDLTVTKAVHLAWIKVAERGTEEQQSVGNATVWDGVSRKRFIAEHPFTFLIRHAPSECVIYLGRYVDSRF